MQRKHGELIPIGEVFTGPSGPPKAIRAASPQARHHFTVADQVNQLGRGQRSGPRPREASWPARWRCAPCREATPATTVSALISWTDKTPTMNPAIVSSESLARSNKDNLDTVQMCPYSLT